MSAPDWEQMVLVGQILRPHGNRGHVILASDTDFAEQRFAPGSRLWVRRAGTLSEVTITACRFHDGRPIIGLDGVESINDAETYRGCELRVPDSALPQLGAGAFWYHDLIGCRVVTTAGDVVGSVIRIDQSATDLLVVSNGGKEVLIPMIDSICRRMDVAEKRIEVELPKGLLEL
jgi:16S rRNA processing protein RimM